MTRPSITKAAVGLALAVAFAATVVAANWAVQTFQPWTPTDGLIIPAGVWFAGLAFTLRDLLQKAAGKSASLVAIAAGTAISYQLGAGKLALAAALAFALSELVDFCLFVVTDRRYGYLPAIITSGAVALAVDSYVFLTAAPPLFPGANNADFLLGQIVGKAGVTAAFVLVLLTAGTIIRERREARYEAAVQRRVDDAVARTGMSRRLVEPTVRASMRRA